MVVPLVEHCVFAPALNAHADSVSLPLGPLLQSMHAETTRYYSCNLTVREVIVPKYALNEKYTIEKGTTVFIPNKFAGQFTSAWELTRPKAVSRPLDEFWAERYLVDEVGKRERFSDVGLGGNWTSFGGGEHVRIVYVRTTSRRTLTYPPRI